MKTVACRHLPQIHIGFYIINFAVCTVQCTYLYYNIMFRTFLKKRKNSSLHILISNMYIVELTAYKFGSHFIDNAVFETGRCHAFALFLTSLKVD